MTRWRDVEVGTVVMYDGGENEGRHIVRVIKRAGRHLRVVLAPDVDHPAAKIAIRVGIDDEVQLPEGAAAPDVLGKAIEEKLGGVEIAVVTDDEIICPIMDVTLIASHLRIMHGVELQGLPVSGEDELLRIHAELHDAPFHEPAHEHRHEVAA